MNIIRGYLGTYVSPRSRGIYTFTLNKDMGQLSVPELLCEAPDSKYLSLCDGVLAAPVKRREGAGLFLYNLHGGGAVKAQREVLTEQVPSCYVAQDGEYVYTANYHEGTVRIYNKGGTKTELVHTIENGRGAGCHQVLFHGPYLLVCCLLQDRVRFFRRGDGFAPAGELEFPKGTGPRHGIFDKEHKRLFLVSERTNQIFVYEVSGGTEFRLCGTWNILEGVEACGEEAVPAPASAAVRLSSDERFLYVSTRFADLITVFRVKGTELTMVQQTGSGGSGPRDFVLTGDGRYLLAANRFEGGLVCFQLNPEEGTVEKLCCRVSAMEAVSVVLEEQECQ